MFESKSKALATVFLNHTLLFFVGVIFFQLQRDLLVCVLALIFGVVLDNAIKWSTRSEFRPNIESLFSAGITSLSVLILVNTKVTAVYFLVVGVSLVSKYLIRDEDGHFFNPSLFGLVFAVVFFDLGQLRIQYDQFIGVPHVLYQIGFLGFLALVPAKRWLLPISFYLPLLAGAWLLSNLGGNSLLELIGPEVSASGLLYIFFMATDPKTSPENPFHQVLFGAGIALLTLVLAWSQVFHAGLIALFIANYITMLHRINNKLGILNIRMGGLRKV